MKLAFIYSSSLYHFQKIKQHSNNNKYKVLQILLNVWISVIIKSLFLDDKLKYVNTYNTRNVK